MISVHFSLCGGLGECEGSSCYSQFIISCNESVFPKQMEGDCDCFSAFRRWVEEEFKAEMGGSHKQAKVSFGSILSQMLCHPHAVN